MKRFFSNIAGALVAVALILTSFAPANAAINPTITATFVGSGVPGQGHLVAGTITFGASDTYVAGGFTVSPSVFGCSVAITSFLINSPGAAYETNIALASGVATVKFSTQMNGASNMTAAGTTKIVTIPTGLTVNDILTVNSQILVTLDNQATAGGGTGTWATTVAVNNVGETSTSTFTLTTTAAAPTNNGNFVWFIPSLNMEVAAATPIASQTIPFTATCV